MFRVRRPNGWIIRNICIALLATAMIVNTFAPAYALRASKAYWKTPQEKILLYWIDLSTFQDGAQLTLLRANLEKAIEGWEDICLECGIRFVEVNNRADATFRVIGVNVQRAFLADGFNPSDPKDKWVLKIDRSYFSPKSRFDKVGILRHELGHILGYRHEQIVAPHDRFIACGWKTEGNTDASSVIALTDYDPKSLMHYPCGREGDDIRFDFSPLDIAGHRRLYGPKANDVEVSGAAPVAAAPDGVTPQLAPAAANKP